MQTEFIIEPYKNSFKKELVEVWESSVRATHKFLDPKDIEYFKSIVETIDFNSFPVFCLTSQTSLIGFIGVADQKVEMLFLDPKYINKGFGKRLLEFAISELNAYKVDVNEQNLEAVKFYTKFGFIIYDRTEKDSSGKDYPILLMKL